MIMQHFEDWQTKTVDIKQYVTTVDAQGRPIQSEEVIGSNIQINYWITRALVTNENDKYVGQTLGKALMPFDFDIKAKMFFVIESMSGAAIHETGETDTIRVIETGGAVKVFADGPMIDSKVHYITGVDNVAGLGEVLEVSWRREND